MWSDFKAFLLQQNILGLALAVVVGTATHDLVQALVADFIMPVIQVLTPTDAWREATIGVGELQFLVGHFASALLNFIIIAFVAWRLMKMFIAPPKPSATPATRPCPFCKQVVDATATRCAYCTSQLQAAA